MIIYKVVFICFQQEAEVLCLQTVVQTSNT